EQFTVSIESELPPPQTSGTIYYVSSSLGDDSRDGLTPQTAWRTISKVNSMTLQPGDAVLFRRGDTWRETLTVPSSGNSTDYITFSAYGTGDKPRILGSENFSQWTQDDIPGVQVVYDFLTESFEGTGYEHAWDETLNNGVVDEDNTEVSPPDGGGSEVLKLSDSDSSTMYTSPTTATSAYVDFYVMVKKTDLASGQREYIYRGLDDNWAPATYLALTRDSKGNLKFSPEFYADGSWPSALYPDINTPESIELNRWYHIQFSYDLEKNSYSCYIDGILIISGTLQGSCRTGTKMIVFINPSAGTTLYFDNLRVSTEGFEVPPIVLPADVWRAEMPTTPNVVWFLKNGDTKWGSEKASIDQLSAEHDWYHAPSGSLCIYSDQDPSTVYDSVEAAARMYGIDIDNADYVNITDLEIAYIHDMGIRVTYGSDYNVIDNCTVHHVGAIEIPVQEGINLMGSYNTVRNCKISQCGRHGIYIFAGGTDSVTGNVVENNQIFDNYYTGVDIKNLADAVSSGHIIRNNLFYCSSDGSYADTGTDTEGIVVGGNHRQTDIHIYNNTMYDMFGIGIQLENSVTDHVYIYHNTIYGTNPLNTHGYSAGIFLGASGMSDIYVRNNIVMDVKNACFFYAGGTDFDVDYNCWYQSSDSGGHRFTNTPWGSYISGDFEEWKNDFGFDTHSYWENPDFVDAANRDFHLAPDSPAIDTGILIPGFHCETAGFHPDEGCVEWYGNEPDIGAFEYNV
ncbi:MAG: right-handed parallel beta-helix repeat-containing protein, partial [Candidatus Aenigmarchaeota archaeon]|nr:right-handed parallel beta-helix repeat-containing protein [Candidatus Aenigmarchaeota archaeon]